jgi:hypothetical protein
MAEWLYDRFRGATREEILRHAYELETQLRVMTSLLEGRDMQGMATETSTRCIRESRALCEAVPETRVEGASGGR